jgi:hypothetical protein
LFSRKKYKEPLVASVVREKGAQRTQEEPEGPRRTQERQEEPGDKMTNDK